MFMDNDIVITADFLYKLVNGLEARKDKPVEIAAPLLRQTGTDLMSPSTRMGMKTWIWSCEQIRRGVLFCSCRKRFLIIRAPKPGSPVIRLHMLEQKGQNMRRFFKRHSTLSQWLCSRLFLFFPWCENDCTGNPARECQDDSLSGKWLSQRGKMSFTSTPVFHL
jgi:hypothetical protein